MQCVKYVTNVVIRPNRFKLGNRNLKRLQLEKLALNDLKAIFR